MNRPISTQSTATKITSILYSENRNAFAPSAISFDISCILSVPASALETLNILAAANTNASTAKHGASH